MDRLRALDDRVIELIQEAYLWLWDWTGAYVATLIFASIVGGRCCNDRPPDTIDFFLLTLIGVWTAHRYVAQLMDLRWLNDLQRSWRDYWLRPLIVVAGGSFLVMDIARLRPWWIASDILFLLWNYLACVQVRDREPKEFFPSLKFAGARS